MYFEINFYHHEKYHFLSMDDHEHYIDIIIILIHAQYPDYGFTTFSVYYNYGVYPCVWCLKHNSWQVKRLNLLRFHPTTSKYIPFRLISSDYIRFLPTHSIISPTSKLTQLQVAGSNPIFWDKITLNIQKIGRSPSIIYSNFCWTITFFFFPKICGVIPLWLLKPNCVKV